jgi:hypothetical protein
MLEILASAPLPDPAHIIADGATHDGLYGTVVTSLVTLTLGVLALFGTKVKRTGQAPDDTDVHPPPHADDDANEEFLRQQVRRLQEQLHVSEMERSDLVEQVRIYRDRLWRHKIDPDTGRKIRESP